MDINKWLETAALPAENPIEEILQTKISPLEVPRVDLVPWGTSELAGKFSQTSSEMAKIFTQPFNRPFREDWNLPEISEISISTAVSKESVLFEIEKDREEKEARRHKEMIEVLKEAAKSRATIQIGDNVHDVQIQQGTVSSSQTINNIEQEFDYEKAEKIIRDIASYTQYPQFVETFGENSEIAKATIEKMLVAVEKKEDKRIIKSLAMDLKNLIIGVVGSIIASGITGQLANLGI